MDIGPDDCPCTVNEVELFDPIAKQVVLEAAEETSTTPVTSIANNEGVIEFVIEGSLDEFIDLNETELVIEAKITKADGTNLEASDVIAPVNNWMHSMFSDIKMEIQNSVVEGGEHLYAYKSYLYNLFSHDGKSKREQLANVGWYKDTANAINVAANNEGFASRRALVSASNTVQFSGPLLLDMMLQNRYLLPQTNFRIMMTRMKPEFQTLIHTAGTVEGRTKKVHVEIESATLYIRRVKALASFVQTFEDNLMLQNVTYPIQHTVMNTFTIPIGYHAYHCQSLFNGQLPKLIIIGLVDNEAYNGAYNQNPFNFQHFNVNSIKLADSSGTARFEERKPDFTNGRTAHEYTALFKAFNLYNKSESLDITPEEFRRGYTFHAFNMTPDLQASGHQQISRNSTLRLDIGFSTATTSTINVIAMGVMDGRIQIYKDRSVKCSWNS